MCQNSRQAGGKAESSTKTRQERQGGSWGQGTPAPEHVCAWAEGARAHRHVPTERTCTHTHTHGPGYNPGASGCLLWGEVAPRPWDRWTFMSPHLG